MKTQRGLRVLFQILGLAAAIVRKEDKAIGFDAFEQHHAHRRAGAGIGGGQGDGGGVVGFDALGFGKQPREQGDGIFFDGKAGR